MIPIMIQRMTSRLQNRSKPSMRRRRICTRSWSCLPLGASFAVVSASACSAGISNGMTTALRLCMCAGSSTRTRVRCRTRRARLASAR